MQFGVNRELARDASRFLNRASFGATPDSLAEFINLGSEEAWLQRQFSTPVGLTHWVRLTQLYKAANLHVTASKKKKTAQEKRQVKES